MELHNGQRSVELEWTTRKDGSPERTTKGGAVVRNSDSRITKLGTGHNERRKLGATYCTTKGTELETGKKDNWTAKGQRNWTKEQRNCATTDNGENNGTERNGQRKDKSNWTTYCAVLSIQVRTILCQLF